MSDRDTAPATVIVTPLSEELYRLINRSRRLLWMASARSLEAEGESVFLWQVLCYLVKNGPTVQQDLALATAQDPAGLSRVLEDLEERGFVRRKTDPSDRRRSLVEATRQGATWHRKVSPTAHNAIDDALKNLNLAQRKSLRDLLETLLAGTPHAVVPTAPTVKKTKGAAKKS